MPFVHFSKVAFSLFYSEFVSKSNELELKAPYLSWLEHFDKMYFLTESEGPTEKYLARGHNVQTARSEIREPWSRAKYFPSGSVKLSQ